MFMIRSVGLSLNPEKSVEELENCIVPFVDMFNHSDDVRVA